MDQWYYADTGGHIGPLEEGTFAGLIRTGQVRRETPVWNPDMADWALAGDLAALREYFDDAPDLPERPKLKVMALDTDWVVDPAGRLQPPSKEHFGGVSVTPQKSSWTPGSSDWTPFPKSNPAEQVDPYDLVADLEPEYVSQHRPVVRLSARWLDTLWVMILVGIVMSLLTPRLVLLSSAGLSGWGRLLLNVLCVLVMIPLEAFCLSRFGATPGKWLHEISIQGPGGGRPTYKQGLGRAFQVWLRGQAMGIPGLNLVAGVYYYLVVNAEKDTDWDIRGGFTVVHKRVGPKLIAIVLLWFVGIGLLAKVQNGDFTRMDPKEQRAVIREAMRESQEADAEPENPKGASEE